MINVLFLCARNDARSQMAEGFARARPRPDAQISSAGNERSAVHPMAIKVMAEVGIDIATQKSRALAELSDQPLDLVVDLGGRANTSPLLPGRPDWIRWNLADPDAVKGESDTVLRTFRETRDRIRALVEDFFEKGYFAAFVESRARTHSILNSISDGVMVTDTDGRIMYFNQAAEIITGYPAAAVLNHPSTKVFPEAVVTKRGEAGGATLEAVARKVEIAARGGERRLVLCRTAPMLGSAGRAVGAYHSFQDVRRDRTIERLVAEGTGYAGIIGRDDKMIELFEMIRELADTQVPVLIQGESGTGKELVATAIHQEGPRKNKHFVPVNCGALPEALLESELFGHVRGAFTGAIRDKKGRFELADGGTIFLDEIGDITPAMQVKLLRVVQEGTFERVGSEETLKVDVRIISATNKDVAVEIMEGRFREDLFYRLSVVPLVLPALRERKRDIPLLVEHLLTGIVRGTRREGLRVSPAALDLFIAHDWPGNVREMQNWLQFALVKCHGAEILPEHLPPGRKANPPTEQPSRRRKLTVPLVRDALRRAGGNKLEAARDLGVSRATLYRFLEESGITD
ncbi:MAG: sigma 54-interacting transcriptional regulator [Verrucomicrobia bacterium]|nr:sigma 54-interacting transcriptional regulator [Verrucomicrobiota bacterium]